MKPFDPRLLALAPGARPAIAGLGVFGTVSGLAAIAQAFAVAHLVFVVVRGESVGMPALWVVLAFAVRGLANAATEAVAVRAGTAVSAEVRTRLADHVLAGGLERARSAASDDVLAVSASDAIQGPNPPSAERDVSDRRDVHDPLEPQRFTTEAERPEAAGVVSLTLLTQGATSVEPYVARYLPSLVAAAVVPPAAVLAMALVDWRTAIIPVLTLPLLPLFAALIGLTTRDATRARWRALDTLAVHFLDVMKGLPTLVGYSRAHRQSATIEKISDDHRRATVSTLKLAFLSSAALEFLATISVAIVAVSTGLMLATGRMELQVALPLILLAPEAYWPIRRVGAEFHNAADGAAALDEIAAALDGAGDDGDGEMDSQSMPASVPASGPTGAASRPTAAARTSAGSTSADPSPRSIAADASPGSTVTGPSAGPTAVQASAGPTSADPSAGSTSADPSAGSTSADPSAGSTSADPSAGVTAASASGASTPARDSGPTVVSGSDAAAGRTADPEGAVATDAESACVRVRGVSFRYEPDLPDVLRDLDLDVQPGLTVLTGASGAGKTTLLDLLAGLRQPSTGTVVAPRSHLVTQRPFLAPVSMRDNLRLGAAGSPGDDRLREVLDRVGLTDLLHTLPGGLDTRLGDDGFGLSAGQRARFALARALLSDAPLVLLDEPTAHLDPDTEVVIGRVVRDLADERTVVAIAHRPHLAGLADGIVEIAPTPRVRR